MVNCLMEEERELAEDLVAADLEQDEVSSTINLFVFLGKIDQEKEGTSVIALGTLIIQLLKRRPS